MTVVPVTSADLDAAEISWFSALCSDDYQLLGVPDGSLRSSWEHCSSIVKEAENQGFRNILCPSSYQVGQDTLSFVAGCAPITDSINMLAAVRCGEMQPIMLARTIATLDHMMKGRLTVNIISSDFPGQKEESSFRYQRSREVVENEGVGMARAGHVGRPLQRVSDRSCRAMMSFCTSVAPS